MRDDRERLLDMQQAIQQIEKYAPTGTGRVEQNELVYIWILHHLLILGEAARAISAQFKDNHPEIPWSKIGGMRNVLVHHYFGVDVDIVGSVIDHDLPDLKRKIEAILRESGEV